jgi:hypothetical protein
MTEEISSKSALIDLLRRSISRIEFMDPEVADQLYTLITKCHIDALRSANHRLTNQVRTLTEQLDDAQVQVTDLQSQLEMAREVMQPIVVTPDGIPDSMVRLLNERAGKEHSAEGAVMATLVQLLNKWESLRWGRK